MTSADPADPTGGLFDQLTTYLVGLADDVGFQVELADLDPVCGIGSSQVLDWANTAARHATLAYQRHLLAAPIAFLKQEPAGTHDHELADLLNQDRWLEQEQDAARRQYAVVCRSLFGLGLGLIWPRDETGPDAARGGDPVPDGSTVTPATPAEDDQTTTSEPTTTDTEIDHGHSRWEPVTVATITYTADEACHFGWVRAHSRQPHRGVWLSGPLSAPETRDRVRAAILNSGFRWPDHDGITIRVDTPYPTPDTGIDLAAAVAVLAASGQLPTGHDDLAGVVFLGQLGLDGAISPPRWLGDRLTFAAQARMRCVVAAPPAALAAPEQVRVWEVANLRLLGDRLAGHSRLLGEPHLDPTPNLDLSALPARYTPAVRALEVAAAGGHHLAIDTPAPWEADMLAQLLACLLPDLDTATTRQLARLYPDAGLLPRRRPHRPPWQPITYQIAVGELVGTPRHGPGLASLAHGGVMLVDEQTATTDGVDAALCHLLDRQQVTITSGRHTWTYPARVQLVLGLRPSDDRDRRAGAGPPDTHPDVASGRPNLRRLLDRIDIQLPLPATPAGTTGPAMADPSDMVAARIAQARQAARERWSGHGWDTNSRADPTALARLMPRHDPTLGRVDYALQVGTISPRALVAIRRLAVTIADLAGRDTVTSADVAEAYRLRTGRHLP